MFALQALALYGTGLDAAAAAAACRVLVSCTAYTGNDVSIDMVQALVS